MYRQKRRHRIGASARPECGRPVLRPRPGSAPFATLDFRPSRAFCSLPSQEARSVGQCSIVGRTRTLGRVRCCGIDSRAFGAGSGGAFAVSPVADRRFALVPHDRPPNSVPQQPRDPARVCNGPGPATSPRCSVKSWDDRPPPLQRGPACALPIPVGRPSQAHRRKAPAAAVPGRLRPWRRRRCPARDQARLSAACLPGSTDATAAALARG